MTTFDADKARARREAQLNELTDDLMADLKDRFTNNGLDRPTKVALAERLIEVLASDSAAATFANGDSAGTSDASQMALPSGSPIETQILRLAEGKLSTGKLSALRMILFENDPNHLEVDQAGWPTIIGNITEERDDAKRELNEAMDPRKDGSIKQQLDEATTKLAALSGVDPDTTKKAAAWDAVRPALDPIFEHDMRVGSFMNGTVKNIDPDEFKEAQKVFRKAVEDTNK